MKGICVLKRLLFINILCLLWLPNFCDIKHNGADSQVLQTNKIVSSDVSRTENVPSMQEKEIVQQHLDVILKDAKPNVEYVNNLENKDIKQNEENLESLQNHLPEIQKQQIATNLYSSRIGDINENVDSTLKSQPLSETTDAATVGTTENTEVKIQEKQTDTVVPQTIQVSPSQGPAVKYVKSTEDKVAVSLDASEKVNVHKENLVSPVPMKPIKFASEDSLHPPPHYDGMPSFDEWKKMMLAEQEEKGGQKVSSPAPPGKKISSQKRRRNYSSYECGAKIAASNSEAEGTSRILNELVDEYMLNPCKAKIWFVIELCETVQATQIELANFELFSSSPKDFTVYSSDNFPTRDWVPLGTFTAAEQRVLQSFELKQEGFGKFIKIELLSHYGTEHYCPLSVVRIFGTSMVDEYEEMETLSNHIHVQEDDLDRLDIVTEDKKTTNIFGSATDAVINIVKKAAQALGHQDLDEGKGNETTEQQNTSEAKLCSVADQSQNKCQDVPIKADPNTQPLQNFPIPSSSMHHSLFRLLHRCDQCVSSRIRYYSSAQPHCRFFQAALGPVVFQTLCDWFKEHPVVIAQESSSHRNKVPLPNIDSSPTKSPPPQVMRVSVENDIPWKKLISNDTPVPLGPVGATIALNASSSSVDKIANTSIVSEEVEIQPSIQPTGTRQIIFTTAYNESESVVSVSETSQSVTPLPDMNEMASSKPATSISSEAGLQTERTTSESVTAVPGNIDSTIISETLTDSEVEQITDFISATEDVSETISVTELPADSKPSADKLSDMRVGLQGKVEPAGVSGIATVGQKESVFMRMSNRIKALEINMSLSSQYLQELSQRYRRQMEEMQRAFNRTIGTLNDTARKAAERDLKQQDVLNNLQLQVANLTEKVELLMSERTTVIRQLFETHICLMVIEAIVMITIMSLCVRRISSSAGQVPLAAKENVVSPRLSKRRSSVDSCTPPVARKVKKRSASEEGLNAGEELLIIEPLPILIDPILKAKKRNRKRNKGIQRSNSNPTVPRRNSSSASQCAAKYASRSDTHIQTNVKSKLQSHGPNSVCENCNDNTCTAIKVPDKERRPNGSPFQNLTNGSIIGPSESKVDKKIDKGKEKFSLKKLLKFQKRDSI